MTALAVALTFLSRTPPWVWLILAALVALGLKQAADHRVGTRRLLLQPLALGALSVQSALAAFGLHPGALAGWLLGLCAGVMLNRWLGLPRRVQVLADGQFEIGGSWTPMLLLMLIFCLRYAIAAALAVQPALAGDPGFRLLACAAFGLAGGLFGARAWRVLRQRRSPAQAGSSPVLLA